MELNVEHIHDEDIVPNMTRSPRAKYVTYYEDSASIPGKTTAVWELDKGKMTFETDDDEHRDLVILEMFHSL